jgi:hypothetical protein
MRAALNRTCAVLALLFACGLASADDNPVAPDQRRSVEQTFLTYPEWFLVHSPAEYAAYVARKPAHGFPFIGHTRQLMSSYGSVIGEQKREHYPPNFGYHVMICVIAGSTAVEYVLRSAYENTFGRVSWATASELTEEDRFGAAVAQRYVDFIRRDPWYLYDFTKELKGLWSTPAWGSNMIRKWERRYALTTELGIKAVYGKIIEKATRAAYEVALMTTQVVVDRPPAALPDGVRLVRKLPDGKAVLDMPRYYEFRRAATQLAASGSKLQNIAGNSSVILVTVWTEDAATGEPARVLFEQPLLTMPGRKRMALVMPVSELSAFLLGAPGKGWQVEHVYDY